MSNYGNALKDYGDFDHAIKIKPDYADAYSNMGDALQQKSELDAAINSYKQAIKMKPDYAKAYNNMGITLGFQGHLDAVIESFNKALKIKPDYVEVWFNGADVLEK